MWGSWDSDPIPSSILSRGGLLSQTVSIIFPTETLVCGSLQLSMPMVCLSLSLCKNDHSNLYFTRQEALLAAISEKDANIALLELSASKKKKTQEEVMALRREKDRLVHQLKQQVGPPRGRHAGWGPGRGRALQVQVLLMAPRPSCGLRQPEPGRRETGRVVAGTAFYCCSGSRTCAGG